MAENSCDACEKLREQNPEFTVNGITDDMCESLGENKGLKPSLNHDDCEDLNDINDCLFGNMDEDVDIYDDCKWKDFARDLASNLWNMFKGLICTICGIWTQINNLWESLIELEKEIPPAVDLQPLWDAIDAIDTKVNASSYLGIMTLYTTTVKKGDGSAQQVVAFNKNTLEGNLPSGVLSVKSGYNGIVVHNTTAVPLLIDATFNCSIDTEQRFACCYIVVTRDGNRIGQTPFITPSTYDQQVMAQPFILQPNQSATMEYSFNVGTRNQWFQSEFGYYNQGSGEPKCALDIDDYSDPKNQRSYFSVKAQSIMEVNK